jgi:hypothetical protein
LPFQTEGFIYSGVIEERAAAIAPCCVIGKLRAINIVDVLEIIQVSVVVR